MDSIRTQINVLILLLLTVVSVQGDFLEPVEPDFTQHSMTDIQTRLPCHYQAKEGEQVVQVTWNKILPNGDKDPIIMAHFTDELTVFGRYSGRVKFENNIPILNSALLLLKTEVSDEGSYSCHISTFPNGNFERNIDLTVWSVPISEVVPESLVEGQPSSVVATCRATGRPAPKLSWDTDLPGTSQFKVSGNGTVSSQFSLQPLRSLNGKKLDCMVSHPSLEKPHRISYNLVVQYPPDPSISSPSGHLHIGMEKAELVCEYKGNPEPQSIIWKRREGDLPDGVSVTGKKLTFDRALRLDDSGVYDCEVRNAVGTGKANYAISLSACLSERNLTKKNEIQQIIYLRPVGEMYISYTLMGVLILYGVILTILYCRLRMHLSKKMGARSPEKQPAGGDIYEDLTSRSADTYETINMTLKPIT
uniref:Poliovirus receptor-related 4 n=1 Tax=Iconisemion striatum TaxID=60296 RepID=A0A1A7X0N4_9TELE